MPTPKTPKTATASGIGPRIGAHVPTSGGWQNGPLDTPKQLRLKVFRSSPQVLALGQCQLQIQQQI